jgi:hypothetical protein
MLYATHATLETLNVGVVLFIAGAAMHTATVSSRSLYTSNLYLELVWLLLPTTVIVLLVVRVVVMQCSEEELHHPQPQQIVATTKHYSTRTPLLLCTSSHYADDMLW